MNLPRHMLPALVIGASAVANGTMVALRRCGFPRILCLEEDQIVRASRCTLLEGSGYHAVAASLKYGAILLSHQTFDLIVLSQLSEAALTRIASIAGGAQILTLDESTTPYDFLAMVSLC